MSWQNGNDKRWHHTVHSHLVGILHGAFLFNDGEDTSTAGVFKVIYGHSITRENIKIKLESST